MNKTAQALIKLALTFGATRNLLRELQRKGVKVSRPKIIDDDMYMTENLSVTKPHPNPKLQRKRWDWESKSKEPEWGGPGGGEITIGKNSDSPRHTLFHEAGHALGKTNKISRGARRVRGKKVEKDYSGIGGKLNKIKDKIVGAPSYTVKRRISNTDSRAKRSIAKEIDADKTALQLMKRHGAPPEAGRKYLKIRKPDQETYMYDRLLLREGVNHRSGPNRELGKIRDGYNKVTQKEFKDWT